MAGQQGHGEVPRGNGRVHVGGDAPPLGGGGGEGPPRHSRSTAPPHTLAGGPPAWSAGVGVIINMCITNSHLKIV